MRVVCPACGSIVDSAVESPPVVCNIRVDRSEARLEIEYAPVAIHHVCPSQTLPWPPRSELK